MSWRLIVRSILFQGGFLILPFLVAGDIRWVRGWCWLALQVVVVCVSLPVIHAKNPGLLRARMEHMRPLEPFDKLFTVLYVLSMVALLVVAGMEAHSGGSDLGWGWFYFGVALECLGVTLILAAASINPYLEGFVRIQDDRGHVVVTSGLYSIVRHPMYSGLILVILTWPLLFGSLWAGIPALVAASAFPFRAVHEERVLREGLPGYGDYTRRTRYRLIPGVW